MTASLQESCRDYLSGRVSDYAFRCIRFSVVASRLYNMGLGRFDTVVDLGAGRQDFEDYLRHTGWDGDYTPIDGSIDGTDLNVAAPLARRWDGAWVVAIEIIEHLHSPNVLLREIERNARGAVLTTPNPAVVDVLGCDPTHVTAIPESMLLSRRGWSVEQRNLFGNDPRDTIVAWWLP